MNITAADLDLRNDILFLLKSPIIGNTDLFAGIVR